VVYYLPVRRIIIDIDNTLWDLAPVLCERLQAASPGFPHHSEWRDWSFWKGLIPAERLYRIIRDVHMEQDTFEPYGGSREFLERLHGKGFHIVIASHREKETYAPTQKWLRKHDLPFDEIHLSYDKTVLFDDCWAIVDDSPVTLEKARRAGIIRAGLKNPWNESEAHPLFADLGEIYNYLESRCAREKTE